MAVTPESFRATFRAFNDPDLSPEAAVNYYIQLALNMLAGSASGAGNRFDAITLDRAVGLYVAHHLALDAKDMDAKTAGAIPGEVEGVATAKAVDKVSVSMDASTVTWENEPFWNSTRYGVALLDLVRMFGAGAIQIGTPQGGDIDLFGWRW